MTDFKWKKAILIRATRWAILSFGDLLIKQIKQIFILPLLFFLGGLTWPLFERAHRHSQAYMVPLLARQKAKASVKLRDEAL